MKHRTLFVFIGILIMIAVFPFLTTATAASKAKPIELKLATWNPPQIAVSKAMERWAKLIEEKSGNRVKITFYWAQALAAYPDTYRGSGRRTWDEDHGRRLLDRFCQISRLR